MFPTELGLDPIKEARIDQQIQSLGHKKDNIDISPYSKDQVQAFQEMTNTRISLTKLKNNREISVDTSKVHNFDLPGKNCKCLNKSHTLLKQTHKELHKQEINGFNPNFVPREMNSQNLGFDFQNYGNENNKSLTRTKLLESRKYSLKIAEEDQKKQFVESVKEQFQDSTHPFYEKDETLHYTEKFDSTKNTFNTFSCKEIENMKTYRNINKLDDKDFSQYKSLRTAKIAQEEERVNMPKITDPSTFDYSHINEQQPKKTKFATAILMEKNPDWALLRVKSTMQQDEDKPLYSSFAPDGFFRELLLPQIRVPSRNCRQVPQQLRGMVRVMQLPIVAEPTQLLDTEGDRMPGDTRVLTRPSIFE
ncbi:hypothetical protein SS50377_22481 [Spironucleus salmonicida]|nr:hypothetical protein SS50377_22481 [Spironucleus salmonicida]